MTKRISAMDLRKRLGQVMNEVQLRDDSYIIERDGQAMAALVPLWKLEQLEQRKTRFWSKVDEFRITSKKAKNLESLIREAHKSTKGK
jgi:prevent-host-death family protein